MTTPMTRRSLREKETSLAAVEPHATAARVHTGMRPGRVIGDALLWMAAVAGAICILLVVLAFTAQITLIMFRTGSMSPTIPAGSVAVVQRVPATEIEVGDVVTVDREGELPVTHRVTTIVRGASADERVITMRGDANAADDPFPYSVTSVRKVLFSVPGIALVVAGMGNPIVLGALTVAATSLVVWAFWPRGQHRSGRDPDGNGP
ncbi:signal peptidase I [Microbacterium maritypicum]|uniref:signal peptidase I n=1 Tax=Microbacterium TaxID=33882 RepID=UPI001421DC00|nr:MULTISPECIES: signal peptidase I [Microbacterium]NIG66101.1 signal peptidase I [Microbacterium sp. Be9]